MRLSTPFVILGLVFCLAVDLSAQSVRVVFVSGQASVQRPEEPALRPAVKGETVIIGTRIVTGADGRLVLTPMPGIKSIVTPNTTLLLESATENRTSDTNVTQKVVLDLKEGSVVSDLQKPEGVTYDYSIRTARGLAGARGTTYTVGINAAGIQTIVVAHGAIQINFSDGRKMTLAPGQLSVTKSNGQSQKVENLSQLSPEDQKVAQKAAETTIAAIATAIDAGIKVAPEALNNALAAAKGLGVTLSPETQKAVAGALDTSDAPPPEKQPGDAPAKDEPKPGDPKPGDPKPGDPKPGDGPTDPKPPGGPKDPPPPILPPGPPPPPPPPPNIKEITAKSALDLFLEILPPELHADFLLLPFDPIQKQLITFKDVTLTTFILRDSLALALTDPQKSAFIAIPQTLRDQLVSLNDLPLTQLTLSPALSIPQKTDLLALNPSILSQLVSLNNGPVAALTVNPAFDTTHKSALLALDPAVLDQLANLNDIPLALFTLSLGRTEQAVLVALPPSIRGQLVSRNDIPLTQLTLNSSLDNTQKAALLALPAGISGQLVSFNDIPLTQLTLNPALNNTQKSDLLALTSDIRGSLVSLNDIPLTLLVLNPGLNSTQKSSLLALPYDLQATLVALNDIPLTVFTLAPTLVDTQKAALLALPSDIRNLFVALNEIDIAIFALRPDPDTGLPFTLHDLRTHLAAFNGLKQSNPSAFAMVKDMAGPALVNMSGTPDSLQWSEGAFARTLASWNALTGPERALIIDLGAGEAIMDTSTGYIQAMLINLTSTDITLIKAAGWGRYLADLTSNPTAQAFLSSISSFSTAELAVLKDFNVRPINSSSNTQLAISALAAASPTDRLLMRQLGVGQRMIFESGTPPFSNATIISNVVTFYGQLTADEQIAARALDLSDIFYKNVSTAIFGSSTRTFLQRVQDLTAFFNGSSSAVQQSLQDSRILSFGLLPVDFINASGGSHLSIADTLALYDGLPAPTRAYLDASHSGGDFNFYKLANPLIGGTTNLRPLAQINTLLSGLTAPQFAILIDLDLSKAIIGGLYSGSFVELLNPSNRLADLVATIATYDNLSTPNKNVLRELGIIGDGGVSIIGADVDGLNRLLTAYGALPEALRATTERLDEFAVDLPSIGSSFGTTAGPVVPQSFFFTAGDIVPVTMTKVRFASAGDLHVGATRFLVIDGSFWSSGDTFTVGSSHDLFLHAADLIDLTSTNVSTNIRSITMAAATINLTNFNFPAGSVASLNSKLGGVTFDGSRTFGRVNFNNVRYNGALLGSTADLSDTTKANGNIAIGTLATQAVLPTHVAQGTTRTAP